MLPALLSDTASPSRIPRNKHLDKNMGSSLTKQSGIYAGLPHSAASAKPAGNLASGAPTLLFECIDTIKATTVQTVRSSGIVDSTSPYEEADLEGAQVSKRQRVFEDALEVAAQKSLAVGPTYHSARIEPATATSGSMETAAVWYQLVHVKGSARQGTVAVTDADAASLSLLQRILLQWRKSECIDWPCNISATSEVSLPTPPHPGQRMHASTVMPLSRLQNARIYAGPGPVDPLYCSEGGYQQASTLAISIGGKSPRTSHSLTSGMRTSLFDWMIHLCDEEGLCDETADLALSMFDRVLSRARVPASEAQELLLTILWMATKIEEVDTWYLQDAVTFLGLPAPVRTSSSGESASRSLARERASARMRALEADICQLLNWRLHVPIARAFLSAYALGDKYTPPVAGMRVKRADKGQVPVPQKGTQEHAHPAHLITPSTIAGCTAHAHSVALTLAKEKEGEGAHVASVRLLRKRRLVETPSPPPASTTAPVPAPPAGTQSLPAAFTTAVSQAGGYILDLAWFDLSLTAQVHPSMLAAAAYLTARRAVLAEFRYSCSASGASCLVWPFHLSVITGYTHVQLQEASDRLIAITRAAVANLHKRHGLPSCAYEVQGSPAELALTHAAIAMLTGFEANKATPVCSTWRRWEAITRKTGQGACHVTRLNYGGIHVCDCGRADETTPGV